MCNGYNTQRNFEGKGIRGQITLGFFQEKTLSPELIATTSNKNIHSNKGIDYVESNNEFEDFQLRMMN